MDSVSPSVTPRIDESSAPGAGSHFSSLATLPGAAGSGVAASVDDASVEVGSIVIEVVIVVVGVIGTVDVVGVIVVFGPAIVCTVIESSSSSSGGSTGGGGGGGGCGAGGAMGGGGGGAAGVGSTTLGEAVVAATVGAGTALGSIAATVGVGTIMSSPTVVVGASLPGGAGSTSSRSMGTMSGGLSGWARLAATR